MRTVLVTGSSQAVEPVLAAVRAAGADAVGLTADADMIAAEDTRRTRALLTHAGVPAAGRLRAIHAHNELAAAQTVVNAVSSGKRVAYVTDAGMPGIRSPLRTSIAPSSPADVFAGLALVNAER